MFTKPSALTRKIGVDIRGQNDNVETDYKLDWPGSLTLNASLSTIFHSGNATTNSMCIVTMTGSFSDKVLSEYNASEPGDCPAPLGSTCVSALKDTYEHAVLLYGNNDAGGANVCPTDTYDTSLSSSWPSAC